MHAYPIPSLTPRTFKNLSLSHFRIVFNPHKSCSQLRLSIVYLLKITEADQISRLKNICMAHDFPVKLYDGGDNHNLFIYFLRRATAPASY